MPKYKVLCQFSVTGNLEIEADSAEEAEEEAKDWHSPLPPQPWEYVQGSADVVDGCTEEIEDA